MNVTFSSARVTAGPAECRAARGAGSGAPTRVWQGQQGGTDTAACTAQMPFVHIDGAGVATRYSRDDEKKIRNARGRGDKSVRVSDVLLPNGQILQFEVRFDSNATSKRWHTPPPSGMIQVNLRDHNTRVVEYRLEAALTDGAAAAAAEAATVADLRPDCTELEQEPEPELEPERAPEPEQERKLEQFREAEQPLDRSVWECAFGESNRSVWKAYSTDIQEKLRTAYAADPSATFQFEETRQFPATERYPAKTETFRYSIDFSAAPDFVQTNIKTQKQRRVRRRVCWCTTPKARAAVGEAPLRVLCIDGGGTRGLIPAILMQRIEEVCAPHRIDELFDVVAGTSTGGAQPHVQHSDC